MTYGSPGGSLEGSPRVSPEDVAFMAAQLRTFTALVRETETTLKERHNPAADIQGDGQRLYHLSKLKHALADARNELSCL